VRPDVLVVLPTFEEAENLPFAVSAVLQRGVRILVVDDASPNGTGDIADRLAGQNETVSVLHRERKLGLGKAYGAGFTAALEAGTDWIGSMDVDGSHSSEDLDRLLTAAAGSADLVLGSRYIQGGSTPDWPWHRRFLSRNGNRYARFMLGLAVADITGGFRLYRSDLLRRLQPETCRASGYAFQVEMIRRAAAAGARIVEVPISFRDRSRGRSKMTTRIVAEAMMLVTGWGVARWWSKLPWTRPEDPWR